VCPSGQRRPLQCDVPSRASRRDPILHGREHDKRGDHARDQDRAGSDGHRFDYTVGSANAAGGLLLPLRPASRDDAARRNSHSDEPSSAEKPTPRDERLAKKEQLMNIREVMTPNPRSVSSSDSIQNAARIMRDFDTGAVPVVDNGRPVGIVTDRDIVVRAVAEGGQLNRPVRDIVSGDVICVTPEMSTHEAADLMSEHQVRRLPVVEDDRLVGIVSLGDLAVKEARDKRVGDTLEHISEGVKERG